MTYEHIGTMMPFLWKCRPYAAILFVAFLLQGCGTIMTKEKHDAYGHPFSGVQADVSVLTCSLLKAPPFFLLYPVYLVDLPLSFAADIVLLPVDLSVTPNGPLDLDSCSMH